MDKSKVLLDMIVSVNSMKDAARQIYDSADASEFNPDFDKVCKKFFGIEGEVKKEEIKKEEVKKEKEDKEEEEPFVIKLRT